MSAQNAPPRPRPSSAAPRPPAVSPHSATPVLIAPAAPVRRARAREALALDDAALLDRCERNFFVASGPGGQHRNKTASGVRLTHPPTGLSVSATERRSQAQNQSVALTRLREGLTALTVVPKTRRPTRPTKGSERRRLEGKKRQAQKKADRRGDW